MSGIYKLSELRGILQTRSDTLAKRINDLKEQFPGIEKIPVKEFVVFQELREARFEVENAIEQAYAKEHEST